MNDFDDKAKLWDQNQMHLERTRSVAEEMLKRISIDSSMKALEFGAGTGLLSFFLKDRLASVTLMDTSVEMLQMAESKLTAGDYGRIKTVHFDLEKQEYVGENVDIIFSQMVMHHIADVKSMLEKFYKMLSPGGYLAIADLYTEDGSFHGPEVDVHHGFEPDTLASQLKVLGFDQISASQCFVIKKKTVTGDFREYPVFLLTAMRQVG